MLIFLLAALNILAHYGDEEEAFKDDSPSSNQEDVEDEGSIFYPFLIIGTCCTC
jgi:hypothetical protein